jgi:PAS domain S-box-containing protein
MGSDAAIIESEEAFLRLAGRVARIGAWSFSLPERTCRLADEVCAIFDVPPRSVLALEQVLAMVDLADRPEVIRRVEACVTTGDPFELDAQMVTSAGNAKWVRCVGEPVQELGKIVRVQGVLQDVTERMLDEQGIRRRERLRASLSRTNAAIASIHTTQELFEAACQIAVETGGFHACWIGLVDLEDEAGTVVRPVATAGAIEGYLARLAATGRRLDPKLMGPLGRALREGATVVCNDTTSDPSFAPWREAAVAHGLLSVAVSPLQLPGGVVGAIAHYAGVRGSFDSHAVALLGQLASDISSLAEVLEHEKHRRKSDADRVVSEERFRAVFEQASAGICIVSSDYHFVRVNDEFCRMLGYSAEELVRGTCIDTTHPDDRAADAEAVAKLMAGQASATHEKRYVRKDGSVVWARLTLSLLRTPLGAQERFMGIATDITEGKNAQSERDRLFEMSQDLLFIGTFEGRLEQANPAFTRVLGWSEEDLRSHPPLHFVHPDDHEATIKAMSVLLENRPVLDFENRYRCVDGSYRWLSWRASPLAESRRVFGAGRDVTERKLAEEALREQATLLDAASDAIIVCDLDQRIVYFNHGAEQIYGTMAEAKVGREIRALYPDAAAFAEALKATLEKGRWNGEMEQRAGDGRAITTLGRWTLLRDPRGKPRSILTMTVDITEKKLLEHQLLRSQRMESIGTLAGGIAHDLNNVLAPILLTTHMLRSGETSSQRLEDLKVIEGCAQRGADMVRHLLAFARGETGGRRRISLAAVAAEVQGIMRDAFPKNIVFQLSGDDGYIDADATEMHQLITNLCLNARDAMPTGGLLRVSVQNVVLDEAAAATRLETKPGPFVLLEVEDTGSGMPPEVQDRIFEPFFTTKDIGKGTGLGLSTAHAIVRNHHGFIELFSEPGRGTRFRVHLPAAAEMPAPALAATAASPLRRGNGELILVVDDEEGIRKVAKRTLFRYGYRVLVAQDGAEAISLYKKHQTEIAVVLTDMNMPRVDGPATIAELKTINPKVRIVGSSGLGPAGNATAGVDDRLIAFVSKPYTAAALLETLATVLAEHP